MDIIVYTDGSCVNKVGGYAFIVINTYVEKYGKIEGNATNQIAELYAIYQALVYLEQNHKNDNIIIRSDSMYSILCLTEYIKKWQVNGYMTANRKPIKNKELIITIYNILKTFNKLSFEHVYAHKGEEYNERVDKLANMGRFT